MGESENKSYFQRPYKFSLKLASTITLFNFIMLLIASYIVGAENKLIPLIYEAVVFFIGSFFIIRYRVEKYIYSKINMIYESVSILDVKDVNREGVSTDIDTLKREVIKFAETKRLEIETLKAQEEFRREFIGNLAHELKTPLFTVQGYIETLEEGASEVPELLERYLNRANKGVQRLINITKDLDLITKLETGDQDIEVMPFAIDQLTAGLIDLLEIKAHQKSIVLRIESKLNFPLMVCADKEKINHVLMNLISNSIKYGRENGETVISFRLGRDGKLITSVKDNGEGIKKIHVNRIFERFYRIDRHRSREEGGSGLGLSIVKHILEAHNEKIQVESIFTEGSNFYFSLPICD